MTSGFSGEFLYGGGGGAGRPLTATISGTQGGVSPFGLRQPQQHQGIFSSDQIAQRRADLMLGKRSFADFQSYQQQIQLQQQHQQSFALLQKHQQQQQQQKYAMLQKQHQLQQQHQLLQQQSQPLSVLLQQQQYLMRSVKQRSDNSLSDGFSFNTSSSPGPVYHQQINPPNNNNSLPHSFSNNINNQLNPVFSPVVGYQNSDPNPIQPKPNQEIAFSNPTQEDNSNILNTLQELEKRLLNDDDDDDNNQEEGDAASVITSSEWSEAIQNLMDQRPGPGPIPGHDANLGAASTSDSNNAMSNSINNNVISLSPTSSTSSCCSTSGSPPPLSVKQATSEVATALLEGKMEAATEALGRLAQLGNPNGSPEQRLAFHMCNALKSRAWPTEKNPLPMMEAMYALYELSPCFKFGLLTANLVMLEAIASAVKVHIVDFQLGHGKQYSNLLRAMAERRAQFKNLESATEVKISIVETELGDGGADVEVVKEGLMKLAEKVGIKLRIDVVTRKITELTRESLSCEEGEALVVNFAFKLYRVPDESVSIENLRDELLRRVKGLGPRAVTLVEQEMNANTASFMTRVNEACGYYGALFESLEFNLPRDNLDRVRVEEGLGRKMTNVVAYEGRERVERAEVFGKWRARMGMAGFELKPLGPNVVESMRTKLNSTRVGNPSFVVKEENGGVGFGWMGRTLTVASAWR